METETLNSLPVGRELLIDQQAKQKRNRPISRLSAGQTDTHKKFNVSRLGIVIFSQFLLPIFIRPRSH